MSREQFSYHAINLMIWYEFHECSKEYRQIMEMAYSWRQTAYDIWNWYKFSHWASPTLIYDLFFLLKKLGFFCHNFYSPCAKKLVQAYLFFWYPKGHKFPPKGSIFGKSKNLNCRYGKFHLFQGTLPLSGHLYMWNSGATFDF